MAAGNEERNAHWDTDRPHCSFDRDDRPCRNFHPDGHGISSCLLEGVLNRKYPKWKEVKRFEDGSAQAAPAGLRVLEKVMQQEFGEENVVPCYPEDLDQFIGSATKVVAVSTHNPLGVTSIA